MHPQGAQFFDESQQRSFERGQAQGQAKTIVAVLEARGLAVTDEQRERILASTDSAELERWARKAAIVTSADDLFAD
jgi:hypothetical protein